MINSIKTVICENWMNRSRMIRLANYEAKAQNNGTLLGFLWYFLNPALQILVYWFVFSTGLQVPAPREGYPYIIWMIVGVIPWFFISATLQTGAMSINSYTGVLKKVYIPLAIVPIKTIVSGIITHIWSMIVVFAVIILSGYTVSTQIFQLPYYLFCIIFFLAGWSLLTSAIMVLFKDLQKILAALIRLLFYISPVVWDQSILPEQVSKVFNYNPLSYVLQGYRNCILYGVSFTEDISGACYFWIVSISLFCVGASVHMKFRKKFMDLL